MSRDLARCIFQATAEGEEALRLPTCALPEDYRRVLHAIRSVACFSGVVEKLADRPRATILRCLEDLEAIGLAEYVQHDWLVELYRVADIDEKAA